MKSFFIFAFNLICTSAMAQFDIKTSKDGKILFEKLSFSNGVNRSKLDSGIEKVSYEKDRFKWNITRIDDKGVKTSFPFNKPQIEIEGSLICTLSYEYHLENNGGSGPKSRFRIALCQLKNDDSRMVFRTWCKKDSDPVSRELIGDNLLLDKIGDKNKPNSMYLECD